MQKLSKLFKNIGPFTKEVIDNSFDVEGVSSEEFVDSVQEVFLPEEDLEELEEEE